MKKHRFKHQNEEDTKAYIKANKLDAQKTDSGLYYSIFKEGDGKRPGPDSNITIAYFGYFTDDEAFDQNENFEINMAEVIPGWTEGIQLFKEGGEGILFVPAHLGYGIEDNGSIPGGSVLIFDIQLIKVD